MRKRLAGLCLLSAASLLLCSCALVQTPLRILGGLLGLGTRVLNMVGDNNRSQPFRLETGEIDRSRETLAAKPVTPAAVPDGNVAVR